MTEETALPLRLRMTASRYQCDCCPPQRVCAWDCVQGAAVPDILYSAVLALEGTSSSMGRTQGNEPTHAALWECYNASQEP